MSRRHPNRQQPSGEQDRRPWVSERIRRLRLTLQSARDARARLLTTRALEGLTEFQQHRGSGATVEDFEAACRVIDQRMRRLLLLTAGLAAGKVGLNDVQRAAELLDDATVVAGNLAHLNILSAASAACERGATHE